MNKQLLQRLEKGPIAAVYGQRGWRVLAYPAGVKKADVESACAFGVAEWHFTGLRLTDKGRRMTTEPEGRG